MCPTQANVKTGPRPVPAFMRRTVAEAPSQPGVNVDNVRTRKASPSRDARPTAGGSPENLLWEMSRWPAYDYTRERRLCLSGAAGYDIILEGVRRIVHEQRQQIPDHIHSSVIEYTARSISEFCTTKLVQGSGRTYVDPQVAKERREKKQWVRNAILVAAKTPRLAGLKKATVRNLGDLSERPAATVHRVLMSAGISPRRDKKIAALLPHQRKLVRILDSIVPRYGLRRVVEVDAIIAAAYPEAYTARSTPAMREAHTLACLAVAATADIGLHVVVEGDRVGVARGVRLGRSLSDIAAFIATSRLSKVPRPPKAYTDPVDEALADAEAMFAIAFNVAPQDAVWRLGHLCSPALDRRPLDLLVRELRLGDWSHIEEAKINAWNRAERQGNPVNFHDYDLFIHAAFCLNDDDRRRRSVGKSIKAFIEDSGLRLRLETLWRQPLVGIDVGGP